MKELLCFQLAQFFNFQRNSLEKYMTEIGLHAGQVFILSSLWESDGQSQAEIVRNLQVTPPTVYNMVIRLQESGFVELRKCENDARLIRVFLTEKGFSIKPAVEEQWLKLENFLFSEMSEPEKMMFSMLLQKIRKK
jgi:MarR family transcriptional regulator, organic hydroperoxide resistance regulator